jgi:hypothetical protein
MFEPACAFGHATAITAGSIFPRLFSANSAVPLLAVPETDAGAATVLVDELDAGGLKSVSDHVESRATRLTESCLQLMHGHDAGGRVARSC